MCLNFIFSHNCKGIAVDLGARQNYHHSFHIKAKTWNHLNVSDDVHISISTRFLVFLHSHRQNFQQRSE